MIRRPGRVAEAGVFTAGALVYIWWFQRVAPYSVVFLLAGMAASFWKHSETMTTLGFGWAAFLEALRRWWPAWLILAPTAAWLGRNSLIKGVFHALIYAFWCILQQLTYQKMVSNRLREGVGPSWKARTASGALFSIVHLPNPVLTPATFVWGVLSSYLFEWFPSVPALGILQFLLSSLVFLLTPVAWNHNMRVGPAYLNFR